MGVFKASCAIWEVHKLLEVVQVTVEVSKECGNYRDKRHVNHRDVSRIWVSNIPFYGGLNLSIHRKGVHENRPPGMPRGGGTWKTILLVPRHSLGSANVNFTLCGVLLGTSG